MGDVLTAGWTAYTLAGDITATTGQYITIVEVDSGNKAVKAGNAIVTLKA